MDITEIKLWKNKPVEGSKRPLASGQIVFDNEVSVRFRVMDGNKGLWVGLPGSFVEKDGERKWYSDVYIVDKEFKSKIEEAVLSKYNNVDGPVTKTTEQVVSSGMDDSIPF